MTARYYNKLNKKYCICNITWAFVVTLCTLGVIYLVNTIYSILEGL